MKMLPHDSFVEYFTRIAVKCKTSDPWAYSKVDYILRGSWAAWDGKGCNLKSSDNDLESKSKELSRSSWICPERVWHRRHITDIQLVLDGKTGNISTVPSLIELSMLKHNSVDNYLHTLAFLETQVNCFFPTSFTKLAYPAKLSG